LSPSVSSEVEVERDGSGGGGAAAAALDCSAGVVGYGGQQPGQSCVFRSPLREPHVVLGHCAAVPLLEGVGGAGDQLT